MNAYFHFYHFTSTKAKLERVVNSLQCARFREMIKEYMHSTAKNE
jgi:hypothetical protein